MVDGLDMTLDDLIKRNKKSGGRDRGNVRAPAGGGGGRGRGGGGRADYMSSGPGPTRMASVIGQVRTTPYTPLRRASVMGQFRATPYPPPPPPGLWMPETGMVEERSSNAAAAAAGTKLYVSNLGYGVTNHDIEVLFSDVGELIQHGIHCDLSGRSKGTAEVVFARHSDALKAIQRYNGARLDRRPVKIEIIGGGFVPSAPSTAVDGSLGYQRGAFRSNSRDGIQQGGGRGQGGRRKREHAEKVSAEALDADLEKYHQDAMLK